MELPEKFVEETRRVMGDARFGRFMAALGEEPPVSIRLNPKKSRMLCVATAAEGSTAERVPWCCNGFYLQARPAFTFDPLLHAGAYYVQEAASMFVDHVLRQYVEGPVAMLDLCAAPGGKSTCARSVLSDDSILVSNEPVKLRAQVLLENVQKWGYGGCMVTNSYPKDFRRSGARFDVVLCDVPCSGEGMFRKDAGAVAEWSWQHVEQCWRLQRDIVEEAWQCLNDGGLLIYSTCTMNTLENEENVRWIAEQLGGELLPVATEPQWGITGSLLQGFDAPVYRFIPGLTRGEGLFVAVVRKPGRLAKSDEKTRQRLHILVKSKLNTLYDGSPAATQKGKTIVPAHAEALLTDFDRSQYPQVELDYSTAIAYLRSEAVVLPPGTPLGIVTVGFQGMPLGFAKNIGNRANNLYPKEWRIKTTHTPEEYETILRPA